MSQNRPRIFILEDAQDTQLILRSTLSDYDLRFAKDLKEAEALTQNETFDLYILDVTLPDGDSFALCEKLRANAQSKEKPILFVTGRQSEIDKLSAFERGADDYLTKPFSVLELKARVQAKLRHWRTESKPRREFGHLVIDLEKRTVLLTENGKTNEIHLTNIEFELLIVLTERPEVVKSRQVLLDRVWGNNVSVTDRTVDVHISNLRKKLGSASAMVQSNHGHGYFFKPTLKQAS